MKKYIKLILNLLKKKSLMHNKNIRVSRQAKINYLGIRSFPNNSLTIGDGSIVEGNILFDRDNAIVKIGHDTYIGGNSSIISASLIDIGNNVMISWGCSLVDHDSHALEWENRRTDVEEWFVGKKRWDNVKIQPVRIMDKVWLGFNVIVLKGTTIGEGSVVGAGSVVTKDVPPYTLVAGNPAKIIRKLNT